MTDSKTNKIGRVFSYMRWSSEPQNWGDSEKRQAQEALEWCRRNGRTLCDQTYTDRGVSAWKGANRRSGALGALLKVAGERDIILVEDTDRWSREEALDALTALRDTVENGVEVVFLRQRITVNKINFNDESVIIPLFFGSLRANSENNRRSGMIRKAVQTRRELLEKGIAVRGRLPAWLDWDGTADTLIDGFAISRAPGGRNSGSGASQLAGSGISVVVPELWASLRSQRSFQPKGLPDFLEITGILV